MSRKSDYQFVGTDTSALVKDMVQVYEQLTGVSVHPASPERLFIQWVAAIIVQERVINNYTGNQNIPSRASGENLDALAELFYAQERPAAAAAVCTVRFHISEAQTTSIIVPIGTRVSDQAETLFWETTEDAYVPIGETFIDVPVRCQVTGAAGNGYVAGQINTIVDVFDYYSECENITESEGGADEATDDEFYEILRASMDAYSNAGSKGGYIYFAKQVSTEIADVVANSPVPGQVNLYVLMDDGEPAGTEIKNAVLEACNDEKVRPLTDLVLVEDAERVDYDIDLTYYVGPEVSGSAVEIQDAVQAALDEYVSWQSGKLGRDINPSYLIGLLMQTGIKRVELRSPAFVFLRDGSDKTSPQIASIGKTTITNGGYESA